jgi:subtilisin family serine protease
MTTPLPTDPHARPASPAAGCFSYGLLVAGGLWVIGVSAAWQYLAWFIDQSFLVSGLELPGLAWVPASWGHALALALPIGPLALLTTARRPRAIYRAWALCLAFIAVLALARAFPRTASQPAALAQIILALLCVAALLAYLGLRHRAAVEARPPTRLSSLGLALILAPLVAAPFLVWGALGSPLDTALSLLAGVSLGLFAGLVLDRILPPPGPPPVPSPGASPAGDLALLAWAAIVALTILGSGSGFGGSQLLLMVVLPPLGLAAAALILRARRFAPPRSAWLAVALLTGLVAAATLAFVDPDELVLVLGAHEIMDWAMRAAWVAFVLALLAGLFALVFAALGPRLAGRPASRLLALVLALVAWLAAAALYAQAGQPGFHGERLFVILREQADLSAAPAIPDRGERLTYVYTALVAHADRTQAGLRATLDRLGADYQPYYLVNAVEVSGSPLLRVYLSTQPEVDRVLESPRLRPLPEPLPVEAGSEDAPDEPQWNITSISADRVWDEFGVTGEGIVVGQSDSGVQGDHPALADGYRGRAEGDDYNWLDPWNGTTSPTDRGGHGTHTLGSAVGRGGIGVAPGAAWFGCVNLARNLANPALYLDCLQFMLAPYPQGADPLHAGDPLRAAHVINNSWGCPPLEGCDAPSLQPAVAALRAAGIFVTAGAGNEGPFCSSVDTPPGLYDAAFSVGAVDDFGDLATFSSRGPVLADGSGRLKPDLAAPGVGVLSSTPNSTYARNSGTSMAGPHVVGAVALMWSANPALIGDIDRTEQILRDTARPYTGTVANPGGCDDLASGLPNNGVGAGLLDAYAAVQAALGQ